MRLEPTHGIRSFGGVDVLPMFFGLHKSFDAIGSGPNVPVERRAAQRTVRCNRLLDRAESV
jgi:hypothetical protein